MWVFIICAFWAFLAYRLAKQKSLNVALWAVLGFLLGPIPALILVFKKKNGTSDGNTSFAEQTAEGIQTIRYSVDKITGAMKDAFKKH